MEDTKDRDVVVTPWEGDPLAGQWVSREVRFIRPVNMMAVSSTRAMKVSVLYCV